MGMTMTQKILAAHSGEAAVTAGQLINAKLDVVPVSYTHLLPAQTIVQNPQLSFSRCKKDFRRILCILSAVVVQSF